MTKTAPDRAQLVKWLLKFGRHRWGCAISRQIRRNVITNAGMACDCGWRQVHDDMHEAKTW